MTHLLVTNDFPPKHGGIQSYLWELWRRLPPSEFVVLTTPHPEAAAFDDQQPFRIERVAARVLLPSRALARRIERLADEIGATLVLLDPGLPLGLVGPRLDRPYGVLVHGAEMVVPAAVPGVGSLLRRVLRGARLVVTSGEYPAREARRLIGSADPPVVSIPPGVDADRFHPLGATEKAQVRRRLGVSSAATVVLGVSRLVPRKGFDVVLEAAARLRVTHPDLVVVIAGGGRDQRRLETLARRTGAPGVFTGRVTDDELPEVYGAADLFAMLARSRWWGLEQEGFGIVFLEAAAAGLPQVGGASGGVAEPVADGQTGLLVERPHDVDEVTAALDRLLSDADLRAAMGAMARRRAIAEFDRDVLAARLHQAIVGLS